MTCRKKRIWKKRIWMLLLSMAGLLFWGCAMTVTTTGPEADDLPPIRNMDADDVAREIRNLEASYPVLDDLYEKAKQMLALSLLYAHPENPKPDYERSLKLLQKSRELVPEREARVFRYLEMMMQALRQKEETVGLLHKNVSLLEDQVEKVGREKQVLLREKERLEKVIEELKKLDVEIERHRQDALSPGREGEK